MVDASGASTVDGGVIVVATGARVIVAEGRAGSVTGIVGAIVGSVDAGVQADSTRTAARMIGMIAFAIRVIINIWVPPMRFSGINYNELRQELARTQPSQLSSRKR